jgi:branched-chain amino acid transport system permease protein
VFNEDYAHDTAIVRTRLQWALVALGLILLFIIPVFCSGYLVNLANLIGINVIVVLGLQIVCGYCGQISFGQAAFMGVGAYTSAILTGQLGWSFWVALPVAGIVAGLIGIIGGAPSLRIKGFYLAMATLALHYVILWVITHLSIAGGMQGLNVSPPKLGNFVFSDDRSIYYIIMFVMLLMTFFAKNMTRTKIGRAFVAVRDNDLAAEVMGVNPFYYKLLAFFIACFYAGIAGSLAAHCMLVVHPEQFTIIRALWYIGMLIVGGLGSITGVFFGVISILLLDEMVSAIAPFLSATFPAIGVDISASLGLCLVGAIIIAFLIFQPRGLAHRWEVFKSSYRLYPFPY